MEMMLSTKNLTKVFKKQTAVNNVSLNIPKGCVYGLLGPNGAGKSTTLKMITGIMKPTQGEILFDGKPWNRNVLSDIGALIENPPIYENLSARENLRVRALLLGVEDERIDEVLDIVSLKNTNGLDPIGIEELRELIRSFPEQGITVILSSHILSEVQLTADYIGIISEGILGYEGRLEQGTDLEGLFMNIVRENRKVGA